MTRAVELFLKGGLVMYPLVLLSIFALTILLERIISYRKLMVDGDYFLKQALPLINREDKTALAGFCQKNGVLGEILRAGCEVREDGEEAVKEAMQETALNQIHRLKANINYLDTIVTMAPLLGLLGTVVGMIGSFSVLDVAGSGKPFAITGGVAEALIATATGLGVAIISLCAYTYLNNRIDSFITTMEKVTARCIKLLR